LKTHVTKGAELTHAWYLIDANGIVLGRLASEAAGLLRAKHKTNFTTYMDNGDHVVIVNADKVLLSGRKIEQKTWRTHSGYPGGVKHRAYSKLMTEQPEEVIRKAVRGMLPRNTLGRNLLKRVRIYKGAEHPHEAQQPAPYKVSSSRTPRGVE
jgi:large subunit ribosomal protein L13